MPLDESPGTTLPLRRGCRAFARDGQTDTALSLMDGAELQLRLKRLGQVHLGEHPYPWL